LRDVLFGEGDSQKSYVVLCHKEDNAHVSSVVQDAHNDGSAPVEFRLLDCDYVLPSSQKSIVERFKLNVKNRPTVFVSGKVGPPKQVSRYGVMDVRCGNDVMFPSMLTGLSALLLSPLFIDSCKALEDGQDVDQVAQKHVGASCSKD